MAAQRSASQQIGSRRVSIPVNDFFCRVFGRARGLVAGGPLSLSLPLLARNGEHHFLSLNALSAFLGQRG
jgi:hypothetical protein